MKKSFSTLVLPIMVTLLLMAACRPAAPAATPSLPPADQAMTGASLRPADSEEPAAGICASSDDILVLVRIVPGAMPDPRCLEIQPDQYLQFRNETNENVLLQLGRFEATIRPGEMQAFDEAGGSFLAAGVHRPGLSAGSAPEIWLKEE